MWSDFDTALALVLLCSIGGTMVICAVELKRMREAMAKLAELLERWERLQMGGER